MSKRSSNRTIDHPIGKGKAMEMASWTAGFNKVPGTIFFVFAGSLTLIGRDEMISR